MLQIFPCVLLLIFYKHLFWNQNMPRLSSWLENWKQSWFPIIAKEFDEAVGPVSYVQSVIHLHWSEEWAVLYVMRSTIYLWGHANQSWTLSWGNLFRSMDRQVWVQHGTIWMVDNVVNIRWGFSLGIFQETKEKVWCHHMRWWWHQGKFPLFRGNHPKYSVVITKVSYENRILNKLKLSKSYFLELERQRLS